MTKKARRKAPQLRFPEFKGDWKTDRADHFLVRYVNPVDVQLDTEYEQIGIRSHGKGIFHKEPVTGRELGNKRVYWVHPEAFTVNIVFAWEQAVALTSDAEKGFIASHRFLMFLPKENRCDLKFILLFFLRKRGKTLLELASPGGAGRNKTLGQDNFAELQLTLPQKEEQEKIGSFLGLVDTRLTQLRRKHELLQTYKRGVMQKIFSQQIRFKSDDGQPFPDWKEKKLGDIADTNQPHSFTGGPFGSDLKSSDYTPEGIRVIQLQNIGDGYFLNDYQIFTSEAKANQLISCNIYPNDILLSKMGDPVARACIVPNHHERYLMCSDGIRLAVNNKLFNTYFIYSFLNAPVFRKSAETASSGSTRKRIGLTNLRGLKLACPVLQEQEKIANFLTAIDQKIEAIAQQIDLTEQFKKGLLQKMFV